MRKWSRWQDWVALVAGVYAILAPLWTDSTNKATWTLVVLGALTAVAVLFTEAAPGMARVVDWLIMLMGVLFFISPWVMGFDTVDGMAWTAWIVGGITFLAGLFDLPQLTFLHRGGPVAQH